MLKQQLEIGQGLNLIICSHPLQFTPWLGDFQKSADPAGGFVLELPEVPSPGGASCWALPCAPEPCPELCPGPAELRHSPESQGSSQAEFCICSSSAERYKHLCPPCCNWGSFCVSPGGTNPVRWICTPQVRTAILQGSSSSLQPQHQAVARTLQHSIYFLCGKEACKPAQLPAAQAVRNPVPSPPCLLHSAHLNCGTGGKINSVSCALAQRSPEVLTGSHRGSVAKLNKSKQQLLPSAVSLPPCRSSHLHSLLLLLFRYWAVVC